MTSLMKKEATETPDIVARQLQENHELMQGIGQHLRTCQPRMLMLIGRGSSDHAGVFGKYLIEIETGVPTFAAAPSVASVYGKPLKLEGAVAIVISQSGRSPDIIAQAEMAKSSGAYVIALVNDETAPIRDVVDAFVPLKAGEEKSVAATKSYLATLTALLHLTAHWSENQALLNALDNLPAALRQVVDSAPQLTDQQLIGVRNLVVLGRGLGYATTREIALKMKEVCSIHAESFSSAEFLHGPVTLVEKGLSIVNCSVEDESATAHKEQIDEMDRRGANLIHLHQSGVAIHPRLAPLLVLQRFYLDIEAVAQSFGFNPDEPKGLKKVTRTL